MNKLKSLAAFAIVATVTACAAPPEPASRSQTLEATAVVESIDVKTRNIHLKTEDGRELTIVAGPEVRNFDQIEPGDRIKAIYYESVAVEMAADDATGSDAVAAVGRAPEGEKPGAFVGASVREIVTIVSFDPGTNIVVFTTPDGFTTSLVVKPEMREFARAVKPGDRVDVTYTQSLAIGVTEIPG
jgi:translation elongation factor P/translation initiation factor 5A